MNGKDDIDGVVFEKRTYNDYTKFQISDSFLNEGKWLDNQFQTRYSLVLINIKD